MSFSGVVCSVSRGVNGMCVRVWGWGKAWGFCECMIAAVRAAILLGNRDQNSGGTGVGARGSLGDTILPCSRAPGPLTAREVGFGSPQRLEGAETPAPTEVQGRGF